jgi:hypothetical protein
MDPFQYAPFKSSEDIRTLHLQPGKKEDSIICFLTHVSFASKPTYKALSYTWGTDSKTHTVYCAGKVLPITANLYSALRRFREEDSECIIWADAICINQNDIPERNQQVQIMRQVYASASEVVIWLGEEAEGDERAFNFVNSFDRSQKEEFTKLRIDWDAPGSVYNLPNPGDLMWKHMAALLERPWLGRVWVIQEVAMAVKATVFCGSQMCPWENLSQMISYMRNSGLMVFLGSQSLGLTSVFVMASIKEEVEEKGVSKMPLIEMLVSTRPFFSTDPRDRFFALLGLFSPLDSLGVEVDYSLPCEELYTKWAADYLVTEKNLLLLSLPEHSPDSELSLQSWVPDWSCAPFQIPRNPLFEKGYEAAGRTKVALSISEDAKVLRIKGYKLDVISRAATNILGIFKAKTPVEAGVSGFEKEQIGWEKGWFEECDDIALVAQPHPGGEDFVDVMARVLVCSQMSDKDGGISGHSATPEHPLLREVYRLHRQILDNRDEYESGEKVLGDEEAKDLYQYTNALIFAVAGRRFCSTGKRYLGWVPRAAVAGDIICIFAGGEVPFIIRPLEGHSDYYELVGECYIHGIMQGEAMQWEGISEQEFKIQ